MDDQQDKKSPATPAPTPQAAAFMTEEEIEEHHKDKGKYEVINGMKMGHAKVPTFLKFVYGGLALWGLIYLVTAHPINDRTDASPSAAPSVAQGQDIFSTTCSGCHNPTDVRKVGPGLKGVFTRLGEKGLDTVLQNGRPAKGMPQPASLGLNPNQIASIKLYLESLK
ncbi:MAG: c-type cytochrome [Tumebacillaceae bacterium]